MVGAKCGLNMRYCQKKIQEIKFAVCSLQSAAQPETCNLQQLKRDA